MTGVRINRGDHPVLRDPAGDLEPAVVTGFEVLANDGGQQLGRFAHFDIEDSAVEHTETGVRVGGEFGGTDRRPVEVNRSANNSSGNNL